VSAAPAPSPLRKRNMTDIDVTILQYALTLEHLENTFYSQALNMYSEQDFTNAGYSSDVRSKIQQVSGDEATHVNFLSTALQAGGVTPTAACTYDFGYNSVSGFLGVASVLEGVGVSAYLGAAAEITNPAYLTAAGAILTVEARHSAYIRDTIGESPFPEPFDIPLDFDQVYSLAAEFITSCPSSNPTLPVKAFPGLTAKTSGKAKAGGQVQLIPTNSSSIYPDASTGGYQQLYAAFINYPTTSFGEYNKETMMVTIPPTSNGQTYVVLTTSNSTVTDENTVAGVAVLEVCDGNDDS